MNDPSQPKLVRTLGRWSLTALVINSILGSGIFGLPSAIAKLLGPSAPLAYAFAAAAIGIIVMVFAEVSSQFRESGGQYLYAHDVLGHFTGIQVAWFFLLTRLTSAGAVLNLFVNYLGEFWPELTAPGPRAAVMTALIVSLVVVNYRGVRAGAGVSNLFTVAKVATLGCFAVGGLVLVHHVAPSAPEAPTAAGAWPDALVALVFAFGGFEGALVPAAETKDPRHDTPFALGAGITAIAALYLAIHVVAMWSVPDLAHSERPLADAARTFAGPAGAAAMALGALLSTYGWLSGAFVTMPRLIYAMAERRDFPGAFAAVHPRFRSPHLAILLWAILVLGLGIYGSFIWNAIFAGVARLVTWAVTCAVLIRLRRREPRADAWRVPAGNLIASLGIVFCAVLALRMTPTHVAVMGGVVVVATANWLAVRRRAGTPPAASTRS